MEHLRRWLDQHSMTPNQGAKFFAITRQYMWRILTGRQRPSFELMTHIAARTNNEVPVTVWAKDVLKQPRRVAG